MSTGELVAVALARAADHRALGEECLLERMRTIFALYSICLVRFLVPSYASITTDAR